jgi:F1F0 ATPase subunit 2
MLALVEGCLLGAFFFGGLLWTIRRGISSKSPALWFAGSLLLRMTVALSGFYLSARGDWRRLAACMLGFFLARVFVTRLGISNGEKEANIADGGGS